jgi:cell division protein FtsW
LVALAVILVVISKINLTKNLKNGILVFNLITIGLLVCVLVFGREVNGAKRFLQLGPFTFQPSTLARMAIIFHFSYFLSQNFEKLGEKNLQQFIFLFIPATYIVFPQYAAILWGKHLSTITISILSIVALMWLAGVRKRFIGSIFILGFIGFASIIILGSHMGGEYRGTRVKIYRKYCWYFPNSRQIKIGGGRDHQARESIIALRAGGLTGVGSDKGLAKHNYISDVHTDYAFTMIAEQWGFVAGFVIIGLYVVFLVVTAKEMMGVRNRYLRLLGMGLAFNIFMNAFVHIGVNQCIIFPTGQTLPFVSWGGTSFVVDLASAAVIYNIMIHKGKLYA